MAKRALNDVNQTIDRQIHGKGQKPLQLRQVSTNKQVLTENNMDKQKKKVLKGKKNLLIAAEKIEVAEKENTPVLRRSKRKIIATLNESHVKSNTKKSSKKKVQSLKKSKTALKSVEEHSNTVINEDCPEKIQCNLNFSPVTSVAANQDVSGSTNSKENVSITSTQCLSEDSGFESSTRVSDQSSVQTRLVSYSSADNEASILTCDTPPQSYWRDLAEQRRIALETALYENESLHDQLSVLEAENSQLKQLIKQAEEFAGIVNGIIS